MNPLHLCHHAGYHFGTSYPLSADHLRQLVKSFSTPDQEAESPLGGRRSVCVIQLAGIGPVVVKHYRRGGWLAHLINKTYFKWGKPRCRTEFEQMLTAKIAGVRTPEPVAYAYRGGLFYNAWLVTKKIQDHTSLAQLSIHAPDRAERATRALVNQVNKLIDNSILHADFHPGNVLVDDLDRIYLIDFDKSRPYNGSAKELKQRYLKRWQRAVIKHDLPALLLQILRTSL